MNRIIVTETDRAKQFADILRETRRNRSLRPEVLLATRAAFCTTRETDLIIDFVSCAGQRMTLQELVQEQNNRIEFLWNMIQSFNEELRNAMDNYEKE